ncbi:MAG: hypothetical protein KAI50_11115 [Desulfobacterales bacterium]|nr:hypothetical protein [Desulfobacterales bacterium]
MHQRLKCEVIFVRALIQTVIFYIMNGEQKRKQNERKFGAWNELPNGKRRYFYEVQGRYGWLAR